MGICFRSKGLSGERPDGTGVRLGQACFPRCNAKDAVIDGLEQYENPKSWGRTQGNTRGSWQG